MKLVNVVISLNLPIIEDIITKLTNKKTSRKTNQSITMQLQNLIKFFKY